MVPMQLLLPLVVVVGACILSIVVYAKRASPGPKTGPSFGKASKGGDNQCVKYCGPKYFVGGAYSALMQEMKDRQMPAGVGFHLHPMGFLAAHDAGFLPQLLSRFSAKFYLYEADLDAWTDGTNSIQTSSPGVWGDLLNNTAGGWKCALFAPWAKSVDVAAVQPAIDKYKRLFEKIRQWGCRQCWIFWSPPSEPRYNRAVMQKQAWAQIAKATGASGICVDHPAQRSDALEVSFAALKWAKQNGLGAGWVFNGTASAAQVGAMVQQIKAHVGPIDFIASDNFSSSSTGWAAASTELRAFMGRL